MLKFLAWKIMQRFYVCCGSFNFRSNYHCDCARRRMCLRGRANMTACDLLAEKGRYFTAHLVFALSGSEENVWFVC